MWITSASPTISARTITCRAAVRHARGHENPLHVPDRRRIRDAREDCAGPQRQCADLHRSRRSSRSASTASGCRSSRCPVASLPPARGGRVSGQAPPAPTPAAAAEDDDPTSRRPGAAQAAPAGRGGAPRDREARNHIDDQWQVRVPVTAGDHDVVVAFLKKSSAIDETPRLPFLRPYPAGQQRAGDAHGRGTPQRGDQRALHARAVRRSRRAAAASLSVRRRLASRARRRRAPVPRRRECATRILSRLARYAYRRPVAAVDVQPLIAQFHEGWTQGGFDAGIERAIRRLLVSPEFLYRVEVDPPNLPPNTAYRVSDLELASRLSFFLWSSIPDDELLDVAAKRQLSDPAVLARQVRRMMADPRSDAFSQELRRPVAVPAQRAAGGTGARAPFPISTTTCARRCAAKPSCSSRASCARIATRSTCCAPTTRS